MCRPSGAWCSARMRSHRSRGGLRSFVLDGTGQMVPQLGEARGKSSNRSEGQLPNLASSRSAWIKQEAAELGGLLLERIKTKNTTFEGPSTEAHRLGVVTPS